MYIKTRNEGKTSSDSLLPKKKQTLSVDYWAIYKSSCVVRVDEDVVTLDLDADETFVAG